MYSPDKLFAQLQRLPQVHRYWIGYSGGLDSLVLLHSFTKLREQHANFHFTAVHLHHGLHPDADLWAHECRAVCEQFGVELMIERLNVTKARGDSLEDAARKARYQRFMKFIHKDAALVTAHQEDDQTETILLQLFRGCGPHGLAAMPKSARLGLGYHLRPLLTFSRKQLALYARDQRLKWIEDSSNSELNFRRNFLRHEILPRLAQRWPSLNSTLTRSAFHCANSIVLTDALAELDLQQCKPGDCLAFVDLQQLSLFSQERIANLLRYWLRQLGLTVPSSKRLQQVFKTVLTAGQDRQPVIKWNGGELRRYRKRLYAMANLKAIVNTVIPWNLDQTIKLSELNASLYAETKLGHGLRESSAFEADVTIRFRQGGEICQTHPKRVHKPLSRLFQEAGIPPWQRDRLPLIYLNQRLAAVADLWVCEPFAARANEQGLAIRFHQQGIGK